MIYLITIYFFFFFIISVGPLLLDSIPEEACINLTVDYSDHNI